MGPHEGFERQWSTAGLVGSAAVGERLEASRIVDSRALLAIVVGLGPIVVKMYENEQGFRLKSNEL